MKQLICIILTLALALSLAACGGSAASQETTVPAQALPGSALEILETVWAAYGEEEKFAVIGGTMTAPVDGAPGAFDLADESLGYLLLVPEAQTASITEAASMIHAMNTNTFTCAAFALADGVTAADFGAAMEEAVMNNQWMCGFPDRLLLRAFGDSFVVMAFGVTDAMTAFDTHLTAAYPGMQTLADRAIG